ncbi:hypothetical protein ACFWTE_05435 [Nocardiopsis sp. NPDC058631]|uniref:hypothetical protein n=1 Tax=Nocardiopsis sp. NPDC058631 TaxID=3346566 RepID=UPI003669CCD2
MGHRHPSKLKNSDVSHARARWLLRAELEGCGDCRTEGDKDAVSDLTEMGVMDSLLTGYVTSRVSAWHSHGRPAALPATVYSLAPVSERVRWNTPTQHCMRVCTVEPGPHRETAVDTAPALRELRLMPTGDRRRVLDDIVDGLAETEG